MKDFEKHLNDIGINGSICMAEKYNGMTVNERLYLSGLMDKFDEFVRTENVDGLKEILEKIEITDETAVRSIIEGVGLSY